MNVDLNLVIDVLIKQYLRDLSDQSFIPVKARERLLTPLEVLIGVVLSQNSTDRNAWRALESLLDYYGGRVTIDKIREVESSTLEALIRPAGMYKLKARTIKNIASRLRGEGELMELGVDELRRLLISIRGVGPKTVDVFLASVRNVLTFPVDTHIRRVLYRLGVTGSISERYEKIRATVMEQLPPVKLLRAHYVLILHGREVCKARNPRCASCPVEGMCARRGLNERL